MKRADNATATAIEPLEIRLLGDLQVVRGGRSQKLPPSRKTRALLAYLVLTGRPQRRETLCEMFWDVADDPRGALRWSLSKLRALTNDADAERLTADREHVRFEALGCAIDVLDVRACLGKADAGALSTDTLITQAAAFRGELLEGLDLADFDRYQAFCVAEREQTRRQRAGLLASLTERLAERPAEALPHARTWVEVDPLDTRARIRLLGLALAAGMRDEAQQHFASSKRVLEELGSHHVQELVDAWQALQARPPVAAAEGIAAAPSGAVAAPDPSRASRVSLSGIGLERRSTVPQGLVGRHEERAWLRTALATADERRKLQLLMLAGEAGVGKTRLCEQLLSDARRQGATTLSGSAFEGETGRPYGPWIDALRTVEGDRRAIDALSRSDGLPRSEAPPRSDGLPRDDAAGSNDPAEGGREHLFAGISDLLAAEAQKGPLLLCFDDVQWLDPASAELLHYVARQSRHRRLLLLLLGRDSELADNAGLSRVLRSLRRDVSVVERTLSPLSADETAQLVVAAAGSDCELNPAAVFEQTGGNPLFALELTRAANPERLPSSLTEAVRERLQRLAPEAADVLRWGAVLGCSFTLDRMEGLLAMDLEGIVSGLEELERHALLRTSDSDDHEQPSYAFAHEVVRRVVYSDLSGPRRQLMHRRVAQVLAARLSGEGEEVADIAHHATLGRDHELAAKACVAAARRCLRLYAHREALTLCKRGVRHAQQLASEEARVTHLLALYDLQRQAELPDDRRTFAAEVERLSERAIDLGLSEVARSGFRALSYLEFEGGAWDEAKRHTMQAHMLAKGATEAEQVHAMCDAARCLVLLERDLGEAHSILLEADVRAKHLGIEPHELRDAMGVLKAHQGHMHEAMPLFERAQALSATARDRVNEFIALEHRINVALDLGDLGQAERIAQELSTLGEKIRDGSEAPFARALSVLCDYLQDRCEPDALAGPIGELRNMDAKHRLIQVLLRAGETELARGQAELARPRAEEALRLSQVLQRASDTVLSLVLLCRTKQALDDSDDCEALIAEVQAERTAPISARARSQLEALLSEVTAE